MRKKKRANKALNTLTTNSKTLNTLTTKRTTKGTEINTAKHAYRRVHE